MVDKTFQFIDSYTAAISRVFNIIGVSFLMLMMFLVAADVFLRYLFNSPITGVYEAIELMMSMVFCYGIAYTQRHKEHVSVDLLIVKLSKKSQNVLSCCVSLVTLIVFVLITWQSFLKANVAYSSGETTYGGVGPFGHVAIYPFVYLTSAACIAFSLEIFVDFISSLKKALRP